jgi:hypothetical protein
LRRPGTFTERDTCQLPTYLFSASLKPRRTTCGRARSSRRNRFELGDRRDRRVTVSLTIRHGSPRCARHRSSHAGIESRKRPDRFQLPAWLDSTPADGRRDPWRPAIVAISAFQHEVSVAIRGDASPAWRLSARRSRRLRGLRELRGECANQRPPNLQDVVWELAAGICSLTFTE